MRLLTLSGVLLTGCIWVDATEYTEMRDQLLDFDSDGFQTVDEGGTDCDDTDNTVYPGAPETWYDGVDSDCAGDDDYDRDSDGASATAYGGTDCDDGDADIGPHATETWYDGIDQDCDGGDDDDADGDGHTSIDHEGDDCDDSEASAYPGAEETWYDDIDGDCAGGDDWDADGDGYAGGAKDAEDCDDADPERNPRTIEILGDEVDGDCDGGIDSFGFPHGPTMGPSGLQGPIVHFSEREISVGYAAEKIDDYEKGDSVYDALSVVAFAPAAFEDGPFVDFPYGFASSSGEMGSAFDFYSDGANYIWFSTLYRTDPSERRVLYLDAFDFSQPPANDDHSRSRSDQLYDYPYTGIDLFVDTSSGTITGVACEGASGSAAVMQAGLETYVANEQLDLDVFDASPYDLCEVASGTVGTPDFFTTKPGVTGASSATIDDQGLWEDRGAIDLEGLEIDDWTLADLEVEVFHGVIYTMVLDLAEGVFLWDAESAVEWLQPVGAGLVQADIAADANGNVFLCGVSDAGKLRFWTGELGALAEITVDTGLSVVDQCSVDANANGMAVVAVRGDDQLVIGGVKAAGRKYVRLAGGCTRLPGGWRMPVPGDWTVPSDWNSETVRLASPLHGGEPCPRARPWGWSRPCAMPVRSPLPSCSSPAAPPRLAPRRPVRQRRSGRSATRACGTGSCWPRRPRGRSTGSGVRSTTRTRRRSAPWTGSRWASCSRTRRRSRSTTCSPVPTTSTGTGSSRRRPTRPASS